METEVLHRSAHQASHQRAGAVASDHIARPATRQTAGCEVLIAHHDRVRLPINGEDLRPKTDRNRRKAPKPLAQHALELRLMEAVARVPGLRPKLLWTRPVEQQASRVAHELHAGRDVDE